jgi:hypothetical protein
LRKKSILGALAGALALVVAAVAMASPVQETTFEISLKAAGKKKALNSNKAVVAGTKKKPKPIVYKLTMKGGITTPEGQPATSEALVIKQPKQWNLNSKIWPKTKRCDLEAANQQKSDSVCPKGSKVGSGFADAIGAGGAVTEHLELTAYVITNGNLGFFLNAFEPVSVQVMLEGVVKGKNLTVVIPPNVQEPIAGVPTGIDTLEFTLDGSTKINKKTRGITETTGCKGGKFKLTVENQYRAQDGGGSKSASTTVKCKNAKKKKKRR